MRVIVALDHRFEQTPDGSVWSFVYGPDFWRRYLDVFDDVTIVARARQVRTPVEGAKRVDGDCVRLIAVPYYRGVAGYLKRRARVVRTIGAVACRESAVVLRSGQIAALLRTNLRKTGQPYGCEVIGDPYDVFAPGAVRHPFRSVLRWWLPRRLRVLCSEAVGASYVTQSFLQQRYPCPRYMVGISNVILPEDAFVSKPRRTRQISRPLRIVNVATMDQMYKGHDVLLYAVALCAKEGLDIDLTLVGDGSLRARFERLASSKGIGPRVKFAGLLSSGEAVRAQLDEADLFVLPSRTEGLPRALLEAMARAIPCLASKVGGIPELLPDEDMLPPGDARALARALIDRAGNTSLLEAMSARNLEKAKQYAESVLRERRIAFYRHIADATDSWRRSVVA